MLLAPMGYYPSTINAFLAVMVNYIVNLGIPRSGEVARCWVLSKYENTPIHKSIGTVAAERAVDLIMLFVSFVLVFILQLGRLEKAVMDMMSDLMSKGQAMILIAIPVAAILILLFLLREKISQIPFIQKVATIAKGFLEGLKAIKNVENPSLFILHSIFIWVMYLFMLFVCFYCLPETSHLGLNAAFTILAFGSIAMIATPGGIGAYPIAVNRSLILYGIAEEFGKALGWIAWGGQTVLVIFMGLLALVLLPIINRTTDVKKQNIPVENPG
jgi:uncharacterized protein (TIRG00374 family)